MKCYFWAVYTHTHTPTDQLHIHTVSFNIKWNNWVESFNVLAINSNKWWAQTPCACDMSRQLKGPKDEQTVRLQSDGGTYKPTSGKSNTNKFNWTVYLIFYTTILKSIIVIVMFVIITQFNAPAVLLWVLSFIYFCNMQQQ